MTRQPSETLTRTLAPIANPARSSQRPLILKKGARFGGRTFELTLLGSKGHSQAGQAPTVSSRDSNFLSIGALAVVICRASAAMLVATARTAAIATTLEATASCKSLSLR